MNEDVSSLIVWVQITLAIAAITSTIFPILYLWSPWYTSMLGRALMIRGWSLALALDTTLLFQFWDPHNIYLIFWINILVFSVIALGSLYLSWVLWVANYRGHKLDREVKKSRYEFIHRLSQPSDEQSIETNVEEGGSMQKIFNYLPVMAKALVAAGIAGTGALATAAADGDITSAEKLAALVAAFSALGLVWGVPNKTQA